MLLVVIIMFYNVLWGFSIDPPYFNYNSTGQENCVLCIFKFQGPSRTQIYHEKHLRKKSMRRGLGAERVQVARALAQVMPPILVGGSSLHCHPSSSPDAQLDLKTPIYIPPGRSRSGAVQKHKTQKQRLFQQRLEGETIPESPRTLLHTSRDGRNIQENTESHP
jgi:hypothetical protein